MQWATPAEIKTYLGGDKRHKYNARKTEIDGFTFDSELEGRVYLELKQLHDCGAIADIVMQRPFELQGLQGERVCTYVADFYLPEKKLIVEVKGFSTKIWRLKKKLFEQQYIGIRILVITKDSLYRLREELSEINL